MRRVGEVLEIVGLTDVTHRRIGGFSFGMSQRSASRPRFWAIRQSCSSTNP